MPPSALLIAASNITAEYMIIGVAAVVLVGAFAALILGPSLGSYGRAWEKLVAAFLCLYVLAALMAVGAGIGLALVYNWDSISELF